MGNRAIVKSIDKPYGVYLHWNGGIDSVTGFLEYCKLKKFRPFGGVRSDGYGVARFCQVVGNFFGGGLSIGIADVDEDRADGGWSLDNGIYEVDDWRIVKHVYGLQHQKGFDLRKFLLAIDETQPKDEQLGREYIYADIFRPEELVIGDTVLHYDSESGNSVIRYKVVGITENGVPYIDRYHDEHTDFEKWKSNYIMEPVRVLRE